jgi:hypothetical protein
MEGYWKMIDALNQTIKDSKYQRVNTVGPLWAMGAK